MRNIWNKHGWKVLGLAAALALANPSAVTAQQTVSQGCCQMFHCPKNKFCQEGPPRICFKCSCPRPSINPCEQAAWGYYQPCWSPWPWPPDWNHCPVQPPASLVFPPPGSPVNDGTQNRVIPGNNPNNLPYPRMIER